MVSQLRSITSNSIIFVGSASIIRFFFHFLLHLLRTICPKVTTTCVAMILIYSTFIIFYPKMDPRNWKLKAAFLLMKIWSVEWINEQCWSRYRRTKRIDSVPYFLYRMSWLTKLKILHHTVVIFSHGLCDLTPYQFKGSNLIM